LSVQHVEFLVEEASMEAALRVLLPRLLGPTSFDVHPYQGKGDLLKRLPQRLRGYAAWLPATSRVVVVIDRDNDDCVALKARLDEMAAAAGLTPRSRSTGNAYALVNRLAIEELEAWFFGDWEAVRTAYPRVSASVPSQARYRDPDCVAGGTWEAFERVLRNAGYFRGGLRKIEAARSIAEHMEPHRNTSRSFHALRVALLEMAS